MHSHNHRRQYESDPDDVRDHGTGRFHLRNFIRNKTTHHPKPKPEGHNSHTHQEPHPTNTRRNNHRRDKEPGSRVPRSKSLETPSRRLLPGTRGLFVPAYRTPEHYSQRRRRRNPIVPLSINVIVQFFNCENLNLGPEFLTSPDVKILDSAAVSFLGHCQLSDMPESLIPSKPNPAYRGLSLQGSHAGYHIHYPDCAGPQPFHSNIAADWNSIMKTHSRNSPNSVLLVGVGVGEPGAQCL
ncbi:hypothetical protein GGS24DRAFT_488895 [Hypoxylon argillaceum]|nr:hypothetical protein GGS24DRAFT_488895 [Hypoxylon argillaceum]